MSVLTSAIKPRFHLESLAARNNPESSWWLDSDRFYQTARVEFDRMRLSRYGNCQLSPGAPGIGSIEACRMRKAMAGRVAHGA